MATTEQMNENTSQHLMAGNMNQICKVCEEPAAGFHFGAFTCEGCKSFFGRTYNNLQSLNECKNGGHCVINRRTRTSCKSCRLRKCLSVGMSKSGSRYGRRSNWFKIHFLMQSNNNNSASVSDPGSSPTNASPTLNMSQMDSWDRITESPKDLAAASEIFNRSRSLHHRRSESPKSSLNDRFKSSSDFRPTLRFDGSQSREFPFMEGSHPMSESPKSSSPKDSLLLPNCDSVYPKDLLSLYSNIPALAQRLPPCLSNPNFAQRLLYPYYPHLLSLYSGKQYLDSILSEAKIKTEQGVKEPLNHSSESEEESQPPLKMVKRTPSSPPSLRPIGSPWKPVKPEEVRPLIHSLSPSSSSAMTATPQSWRSSLDSIEDKSLNLNETCDRSNQSTPIDLSLRSKSPESENFLRVKSKINAEESLDDDYKISFVIDGAASAANSCSAKDQAKMDHQQQTPLDLSGFKT